VRYPRPGVLHAIYITILTTHTILAATVPVLAIVTLRRGLKGDFVRHRRIAKWTFPIWLYVSVTGVVVYLMLYQF
jgi:protein SCO1/2/putative membrane protein